MSKGDLIAISIVHDLDMKKMMLTTPVALSVCIHLFLGILREITVDERQR